MAKKLILKDFEITRDRLVGITFREVLNDISKL